MSVSVFIGTSVDGFIARVNGDLDWLPEGGGEPHGYDEFMASVDALVIGRKTFEKVLTFDAWSNRWQGLPLKSLLNWLPAASTICTSTVGLRFRDSCAPASFNVS